MRKKFNIRQKFFSVCILLTLSVLITVNSRSQIPSGTYTIGGTSPDYSDFTAAVNALNNSGLAGDGPVTFNVRNGTYTENLTVNQIANASLTNNIIFQSENNDSTLVILTHSTANATLVLDGADYITFRLITIQTTGSKKVIEMYGGACNNKFLNCRLTGYNTTSTANTYAVVHSDATATKENNNEFRNNVITNGSWGFNYSGDIDYYETGTVIDGNEFIDQAGRAIYMSYQDELVITNNTITSSINSEWYGMYLNYCKNATMVKYNKIRKTTAGQGYGIYLNQCKATSGNSSEVYNNFVRMCGTSGTGYGIYSNYADYIDFYFNNVSSAHTTTGHSAFRTAGGQDVSGTIRIKNNIFVNTGGGYAVYLSTTAGIDEIDYNDYYATGSNLGKWGSADKPDMVAWTSATGETNSLNFDPSFIDAANGDLHIGNGSLEGEGVYMNSVTGDIDGTARSDPPTIGAHEIESGSGPTITVTGALTTYETIVGIPTSAQTFTVEGINLTAGISVTAPAHFEIQMQG
ncbi:MAG: right-handed parallel beta-helix repeat-containing protein, partial [Bacteroidetes bacterium]|nr:right-handed parallel beta-helix repeat-containing protein [Bacteroidota bacterium]